MMLRDTKLPEIMAKEKPGLYEQIREWLSNFAEKLRKAFTGVEARHEEARAMMQYAEEMQQIWDNALAGAVRNAEAATENGTTAPNNGTTTPNNGTTTPNNRTAAPNNGTKNASGNAKYSLREFEDGTKYVDVKTDQDAFNGLTQEEMTSKAREIIKSRFAGKVVGSSNRAFVNNASANEYAYPSRFIKDEQVKEAKMRASPELDNLIEAGRNYRTAADGRDGHVHKNATGGFTYFDVTFKVGDEYFDGVINIENNKNGRRFKDITKIRNATEDIISSYGKTPKSKFLSDTSMVSISRGNENGNTKYSMRDEEYITAAESGNTEEALENSEARLTDRGEFRMGAGQLATVYHATFNDFTVFDRTRLGENTDSYASDESVAATAHLGFWFNTQPLSQTVSYEGGKDVKAYLNAENIYNAHSLEQLAGEIEQQWDEDLTPGENAEAYADELRAQGYDGIVLRDEEFGGTSFVVFDPEQIKSAEAITYDDAGNVIPLSERFNSRSNDIRYSMRDVAADDTADERRGRGAWIKILKHLDIQYKCNK